MDCEALIYIKQGRHPVLDSCLPENKQYVPNDTYMNVSDFVNTAVKLKVARFLQVREWSSGEKFHGQWKVREFWVRENWRFEEKSEKIVIWSVSI